MECNSTKCLEKLVGVRGTCIENENCPPFFIDDIEGIDMVALANTASGLNLTGEAYARQLINTSARLMIADIQGLYSSGYSLKDALGQLCSNCTFESNYQVAGGVKITSTLLSKFSLLIISKIEILCNASGDQVLVIDDTKTKELFPFVAEAGAIVPAEIDYKTTEKNVRVYLQNTAVSTAKIVCEKPAGCDCGSSSSNSTPVVFSGLVSGMETPIQYGFKICAAVSCSTEVLVCQMMNQAPQLFGLVLLYRVAMQYFSSIPFVARNNQTTMLADEQQESMFDYFQGLYKERLAGSKTVKGLKEVVSNYLQTNKSDKCVDLKAYTGVAYVTG